MNIQIRPMQKKDQAHIVEMMRCFYNSPAVFTNGSDEIFNRDVENCVGDNPYVEGYVFEEEGNLQGYAILAKSYSAEFGKHCIWIEDLYVAENSRGCGIGKQFFAFITNKYTDCIFRLEVEEENQRAIALYEQCGFTVLPYMQMKK